MWRVSKPSHSAEATYRTCISRVMNRDLRTRLNAVVQEVVDADLAYDTAAALTRLHILQAVDFELSAISAEEMVNVYDSRMVKGAGRPIYDGLRSAAVGGVCPLCGHRDVTSLDHHLPKARYPALAVAPLNLVPACGPCNHVKSTDAPVSSDGQTLHPYYDDVESDSWLKAEVVQSAPAAVRFLSDPPATWDPSLSARVSNHFSTFRLGSLYSAQAAHEITNIRYHLKQLLAGNGMSAVRQHLEEQANSRADAHTNSWQTAMYAALATSDWFCAGGFEG
jgi:5-methylcytosine-specific restriction endonuclease McrA